SDVYNHYKMPPEIKVEGNSVKYLFIPKNPSKCVARSRMDDLTSNLVSHKEQCAPGHEAGQNSIKSFAHGSMYSTGRLWHLLVLWVAHRHQPYAIIQDPELLEIFKMLFEPAQIPSPHSLSQDVQEAFDISRVQVAQVLQAYEGKLHLGVDGWAAPNVFSYLGVTVTRCSAGDLITMVLDFIRYV
ncbi:hypothetical protein K439DRAFT_1236255, partial [Ramaria rubella]